METHLHLIASSLNLNKEIGDFKSFTASSIIKLLEKEHDEHWLSQLRLQKAVHKKDREYQVWQEGSHPQQIYSDDMMRQKIDYIHNNPIRKGFVEDQVKWLYSSATNYEGLPSLLEVKTDWN